MTPEKLAHKLIDAPASEDVRVLLVDSAATVKVAEAIRRECVESWAKDPKRVRACVNAVARLEKASDDPLVTANADWTRGIASITRGKFELAIDQLTHAGAIFLGNDRIVDAANSRVALLLALAMLGRYAEAIKTGRSAIPVLVKAGDELAAGKIEMNLSNIVSRLGDHESASKFCSSARMRFIRLKESAWQAMAENGLANTAAEQNDFEKAARFYGLALRTAQAGGMRVTEAEIFASMGNLGMFRGRYADALRDLETSRRKFEALAMPHQSAIAELEIADIYAELNLVAEAAEIYERITRSLKRLKLRGEEARARLHYGRSLLTLGRIADASEQLELANKLFSDEQSFAGSAAATLEMARIASELGKDGEALRFCADAKAIAEKSQNVRLPLSIDLLAAETLLRMNRVGHSRRLLEQIVEGAKRLRQHDAARLAKNLLGRAAELDGDTKSAEMFFRQSISVVERLRAPLASEEFSMAFLAARLQPYEDLARLHINANKYRQAFQVIERSRSRSLADSIDRGAPDDTSDPGRAELARVREMLNSYYKRLDRAGRDEISDLQRAISRAESRISKLMREIASLRARAAAATDGFDITRLLGQLGKNKALIEFVESDGRFAAFVLTGGRFKYVDGLPARDSVVALLDELRFQFETLRYGAALPRQFVEQIRQRADNILARLYAVLISPLERWVAGKSLVIVAAGVLNYVPFAALFDGKEYLIEKHEISHAPSAAVWSKLRNRPKGKIERSLLIGFADERIPLVEREIASLQNIVPRPKVLIRDKATSQSFAREGPASDLIHMACHGEFRTDNPMFSSLTLADGRITVRDLVDRRLEAELVTLSACETGVNEIHAGDELLGLARGFLTAGVSSLVVTLWRVDDETAVRLMTDFYKEVQRGKSVSASLKIAQKQAISRGTSPYFWAPFIFIGR